MPQSVEQLLDQRDRRFEQILAAIKRGDTAEAGMLARLLATTGLLIAEKQSLK
jgi:hypothetical protein